MGTEIKRKVDLIVIHCSATKENVSYPVEQLEKDHRARGFAKGGYHRYIRRDGAVHKLRDFSEVGAHVAGHNGHSIGICYEGGLDKNGKATDTRTEAQTEEIVKCIIEARNYSDNQVKRICGHRDLSPDKDGDGIVEPHEWVKMCPCYDAEPEYKYLLK